MKSWSAQSGFTIVEVMIVLAVSGAILASALLVLNGKQQRTQFQQAANDLNSKVQDVINGVGSGFVPELAGRISCLQNGAGKIILNPGNVGNKQGGRRDCVFVGKVVQFQPSSNQNLMNIFTVVGKRTVAFNSSILVNSFDDADLNIVAPSTSTDANLPDLTEAYLLKWGTRVTKVINLDDNSTPNGVAFFNGFGPDVSVDQPTGGVQNMVATIVNIPVGANYNTVATSVNAINDAALIFPKKGVALCLDSDYNQYARLIIGNNGNQLSSSIVYDNSNKAAECN